MNSQTSQSQDPSPGNEAEVRTLYREMLDGWNRRNADAFAASFDEDSDVVGFDGSQMKGQAEIASTLRQIFADHLTAPYVSKVREVRFLSPEIAILRAIVGMVPHGQFDIAPQLNAIQTLVAMKRNGQWRITIFQTTPAQFHGRPELVQQMTEELRQLL